MEILMNNLKTFISKHDATVFTACVVLVLATIAGSIYGIVRFKQNAAKAQAIARAKSMDGQTFTITNISWNWIGDTKLILQSESGQNAGWIAMHTTNPLNDKINPLFLVFTNPHGRVPVPIKVKARFREIPWTNEQNGRSYENFTGSFVEFEEVQ
jgi:hypothetical protein